MADLIREANERAILGRGWAFPPEFNVGAGTVSMVAAEDDIKQSLHILLSTARGERVMRPDYGSGLRALVFEAINPTTVTELQDVVERAVLFYEPRIELNSVDVDTTKAHDGVVALRLEYTVRSTNARSNMVYPFYYGEATHRSMSE